MKSNDVDEKKYIILAVRDPQICQQLSLRIESRISNSIVVTAKDGSEALFKVENKPPHLLIIDSDLPKMSGVEVVGAIVGSEKYEHTSVIMISEDPDANYFVDQVVTGQVQFLFNPKDEQQISNCLMKGLNRNAHSQNAQYRLKYIPEGHVLFQENEPADFVYIVKKGELHAYKKGHSGVQVLGTIIPGEFVGEMAHINGQPRSATVKALQDCELIEIPIGILDAILFSKPAWAKALVATLSKRLMKSNEKLKDER